MAEKFLPGPQTGTLPTTTANTQIFSEQQTLNGSAIKQLHIILNGGTNLDVGAITQIEIFAGGTLIFNLQEEEISQFLSVMGKRELAADAATFLTIPFDWMHANCALPPNAALRVQVTFDNSATGGTLELAYTVDEDVAAACWPLFVAGAAGIAASSTAAQFPITQPGLLKGLMIPDIADLTTLRLYVNGQQLWNLDTAGMIAAVQDIYSGVATVAGDKFLFLKEPLPIGPGTRLELNTGGSFTGAAARIGVLSLVPNA